MLTPVLDVGLASGVAALAVSDSDLFRPLRDRLWPSRDEGAPSPPGLRGWLAGLLHCPLCLGFWACAALWLAQGLPDHLSAPVAWGAAWAVSAATSYGLRRLAG
jgi:hypothetical protein